MIDRPPRILSRRPRASFEHIDLDNCKSRFNKCPRIHTLIWPSDIAENLAVQYGAERINAVFEMLRTPETFYLSGIKTLRKAKEAYYQVEKKFESYGFSGNLQCSLVMKTWHVPSGCAGDYREELQGGPVLDLEKVPNTIRTRVHKRIKNTTASSFRTEETEMHQVMAEMFLPVADNALQEIQISDEAAKVPVYCEDDIRFFVSAIEIASLDEKLMELPSRQRYYQELSDFKDRIYTMRRVLAYHAKPMHYSI